MKINKNIKLILKLLIIIASYSFIVYKLYEYEELQNTLSKLLKININGILLFLIVFALMLTNWMTEAIKWKLLISKFEKVPILTSFKAVLSGITVAIFTPNRTGEFVGRIFVLKNHNRTKAIFSTIVGSISQLTTTIFLGSLSVIILILLNKFQFNSIQLHIVVSLMALIAMLSVIFYFNVKIINWLLSKIKWLNKYKENFIIFSSYSRKELLKVLLLSIVRYFLFLIQFYLLFVFFGVDLPLHEAILIIVATYFTMALIPSITLAELGIRGSVIIYFTELFISDFTGTLSASIILWIINLAIPAIMGSFFIYKAKV